MWLVEHLVLRKVETNISQTSCVIYSINKLFRHPYSYLEINDFLNKKKKLLLHVN